MLLERMPFLWMAVSFFAGLPTVSRAPDLPGSRRHKTQRFRRAAIPLGWSPGSLEIGRGGKRTFQPLAGFQRRPVLLSLICTSLLYRVLGVWEQVILKFSILFAQPLLVSQKKGPVKERRESSKHPPNPPPTVRISFCRRS